MKNPALSSLPWSTASFGDTCAASPLELSALGEHLHHCRASDGRLLALHCAAQSVRGFVATRLVTTLLTIILVIAAGLLLRQG